MKKLAPLFLATVFISCAGDPMVDDSATIIGVVTDQDGAALQDARVMTMPTTETVITDADGAFAIAKDVRLGMTYQVFVAREGFSDKTDTVLTKQGENRLDFTLQLVLLCATDAARCLSAVSPQAIERCDPSRTQWNAGACTQDQVCDDLAGMNSAVCTPKELLTVVTTGDGEGLVTSAPTGISCERATNGMSGTCTREFPRGRTVSLSASPFAQSAFTSFSGACTSTTSAQCAVTMDGPKSVTAQFDRDGYLLTLTRVGGAGRVRSVPAGINCGGACSAVFPENAMVTLTATPDPLSAFGGWGGACASAGMNLMCTLTLDRSLTATFRFITPQFALAVTTVGNGAGTVTSMPSGIDCGPTCNADFDINTVVTLTAAAMANSTFIGWGGDCTGTADCMVTLDADRTVTADFDGIAHAVTVMRAGGGVGTITSQPSGINCGATCTASFGQGQSIDLLAATQNNSVFTGWSGACAPAMTNTTCTLDVTGPLMATATFEPFFFGPFAADPSCLQLLHFDAPTPFAQQCGGGAPVVVNGTYMVIMSRTPQLADAPTAGGVNEEGYIELSKLGPVPGVATIEMTVRKTGAAFDARTYGVLYSNEDALDPLTHGVRLLVRDDGRFAAETRAASGTITLAETAANAIQNNTWYHLAATLNATTGIGLFIDGTRVVTMPGPLGWSASSSTAWAGAEREGATGAIYRFNGAIDEIRVSDVLRY